MGLKLGYKQTEVGVVPDDWEIHLMMSIADVRDGTHASPKYHKNGVPLVTSKNILAGKVDLQEITFISEEDAIDVNRRSKVNQHDILVSMIGTVGNAALVDFEPRFCIKNVALIKSDRTRVEPKFLAQLLRSNTYGRYIDRKLDGGIQKFISLGMLRELDVPLPPTRTEQEAIAEALSDADALIESLEQLLAKKRDLKQGAMQELLTGKMRLPHFGKKWESRRIGDLLSVAHGRSQHEVVVTDGAYPILASGGQIGTANSYLYDKPSVLIGRKGTIDKPQYMNKPFWTVDTLFYTVVCEPNDPKFLFYRFCLIQWMRYNEASGVPSLNARTIEEIEFSLPLDGLEQAAIAAVLTDMDLEIAALETKLTKARQLKSGMMQELLTGRIRLV